MPNYLKNLIAALALAICTAVILFYGKILTFEVEAETNVKVKLDFLPDKHKTGSPFFQVLGNTPGAEDLPLKQTEVQATIAGVIADVQVKQKYHNASKNTLEAIYVFPASTHAAVYALEMTVGGRVSYAKIIEKQQARQVYQQAKKEGKSASLLEQQRPNIFQMSVANIPPGEDVEVVLRYTELLVPISGIYEFVYPTVVAPRYEVVTSEDGWVDNPYASDQQSAVSRRGLFDIQVVIQAGLPVQRIQSPSHDIKVDYTGPNTATVALSSQIRSEKDYQLQYQLSGKQIETGVLLYEGADENFFLAMIQPPQKVTVENIPPREYVFIVDVSGSMEGEPLDITKRLMQNLLEELRPEDKFNVLLFEYGNKLLFPQSLPPNAHNLQKAMELIDAEHGSGGTELISALKTALTLKAAKNSSRSFIIVTDGHVTVEKEAFDLVKENLGDANFFAFGIGNSMNRYLIEGLSHVGKTEAFMITKMEDAAEQAMRFKDYISAPVLTGIQVKFDQLATEQQQVPDVFAERPLILYGKYTGSAKGKIKITGYTGLDDTYQTEIDLSNIQADETLKALRYLWARNRIKLLDDYENLSYNTNHREEITQLGLKYNLLTDYTSFVAVDEANADKISVQKDRIVGNQHLFAEEEGYQFVSRGGIVSNTNYVADSTVLYAHNTADGGNGFHLSERTNSLNDVERLTQTYQLPQQSYEELIALCQVMDQKIVTGQYVGQGISPHSLAENLLNAIPTPLAFMVVLEQATYKKPKAIRLDSRFSPEQKALLYGKLAIRTGIASAFGKAQEAKESYTQVLTLGKELGIAVGEKGKLIGKHLGKKEELELLLVQFTNGLKAIDTELAQQQKGHLYKLMIIGAWNEYFISLDRLKNTQNSAYINNHFAQYFAMTNELTKFFDGSSTILTDLHAIQKIYQESIITHQ
ncbi:MAG: VIT and vWA domain-containing protein [Flammeovirgaceae bacterium]